MSATHKVLLEGFLRRPSLQYSILGRVPAGAGPAARVGAEEEIGEAERATLERLREALGLSLDEAVEIESELPRHD